MRITAPHLLPVLGLASAVAGCAIQPSYPYGPASYVPAPVAPLPPPQPYSSPVISGPLPAPGTFLPDRPPPPEPAPTLTPLEPEGALPADIAPALTSSPPLEPSAADTPPPPSDPVTDVLLAPPAERSSAEPPVLSKKPSPPEANPMMGFRPMRGQTPPSL